jgi:AraC-like DNA-binding protein
MVFRIDWIAAVNLFGTINGVFLTTIILGFKKGCKTTKRILAALVFAITLNIAISFQWTSKLSLVYPHLAIPIFPILFTLGPLTFLYVLASTTPRFKFKRRYFAHFMPTALYSLYWLTIYFRSAEFLRERFSSHMVTQSVEFQTFKLIALMHLFIYLVLSSKRLKKHKADFKKTHSSIKKMRLDWLRHLVFVISAVLIFYILLYFFRVLGGNPYSLTGRLSCFWEILLLVITGYKGLIQPEIFSNHDTEEQEEKEKYRSSALTPEQAEKYLKILLEYMEKEKPFMEPELTIKTLATKLTIPHRHLSQVINDKLNQNFLDFINRYRVEEAKKQLIRSAKRKRSILAIAYDAGFNSKATFNAVFKKYARATPSQFRAKYT